VSICVLVPSRGRPDRAADMVRSVVGTAEGPVAVRVLVDADDPSLPAYEAADLEGQGLVVLPTREGYARALNSEAKVVRGDFEILGAFGDDVLFRTFGWDRMIENALAEPGIAYGNDLVHAAGHPTAIFMSSLIAKALGWLALPYSRHLWVDDAWKLLGERTGTLRYVPETLFEHMHPVVHKAEMDQTYHEVYDGTLGHADHMGFLAWQEHNAEDDFAKVKHAVAMWHAAKSNHYAYADRRAE